MLKFLFLILDFGSAGGGQCDQIGWFLKDLDDMVSI